MDGISGSGISSAMFMGAGAMQVHSWDMAVRAHNVANVSTDGFTPQRALLATGPQGQGVTLDSVSRDPVPAGAASGYRPAGDTGNDSGLQSQGIYPSGTDLAREMPGMISTQRSYEANAQTVRSADDMLGVLVNLKA